MLENYTAVWNRIHMGRLLFNSAVVAVVVSFGKIFIAILSAFAIVFFDFRGKQVAFWMIFITLMLPVPVRIISTYQVVSTLGWIDTYAGLTIPLIASATATFLFRQFYITIPDELVDAAKIDGCLLRCDQDIIHHMIIITDEPDDHVIFPHRHLRQFEATSHGSHRTGNHR